MRRILNDGYAQAVIVAEVTLLPSTLRYAFDLFNLFNLEARVFSKVALDKERYKDGPLRVCVDAAAGTAFKGCEEERSTR
jgi:hypothetical protein